MPSSFIYGFLQDCKVSTVTGKKALWKKVFGNKVLNFDNKK